jgi:hypothetical protein
MTIAKKAIANKKNGSQKAIAKKMDRKKFVAQN